MKRFLFFLVVLIAGGAFTTLIDTALGISFTDLPVAVHIAHKGMYMVWGAIVIGVIRMLWDRPTVVPGQPPRPAPEPLPRPGSKGSEAE